MKTLTTEQIKTVVTDIIAEDGYTYELDYSESDISIYEDGTATFYADLLRDSKRNGNYKIKVWTEDKEIMWDFSY